MLCQNVFDRLRIGLSVIVEFMLTQTRHGLYLNSTIGYSVFMSRGAITWYSRKLNVVIADSSALAEYSATSATCKELGFIRNLL